MKSKVQKNRSNFVYKLMYKRLFYFDLTLCKPGDKKNRRLKDKKIKSLCDVIEILDTHKNEKDEVTGKILV